MISSYYILNTFLNYVIISLIALFTLNGIFCIEQINMSPSTRNNTPQPEIFSTYSFPPNNIKNLNFNTEDRRHTFTPRKISEVNNNENIPPNWQKMRRKFLSENNVWERISTAQLLKEFFVPNKKLSSKPGLKLAEELGKFSQRESTHTPILIEARKIEFLQEEESNDLKNRGIASSKYWDSQNTVLGEKQNIFTFWDDPACDAFVFPSGLYVCGDARIRGSLIVSSGINMSSVMQQNEGESFPGSYYERCTVNPLINRETQHDSPLSSTFEQHHSIQNEKIASLLPWCYLTLTIRSATVYVNGQVEIGGNLHAEYIRAEMGSTILVGLRGIIYANKKFAERDLSEYAIEYAAIESEIHKRRKDNDNNLFETSDNTPRKSSRERLSLRQFNNIERQRVQSFSDEAYQHQRKKISTGNYNAHNTQSRTVSMSNRKLNSVSSFNKTIIPKNLLNISSFDFVNNVHKPNGSISSSPSRLLQYTDRLSSTNDIFFLTKKDIMQMNCPIIDLTGEILFLQPKENNNGYKKQIHFINNKPIAYEHNTMLSDSWTHHWEANDKNTIDNNMNPFGSILPYLPHNTSIGDLITLYHIIGDTTSFIWVFGNVITLGAIIYNGAQLHLHCGHLFSNTSDSELKGNGISLGVSIGLTAFDSGIISSGGLLESVVPKISLQRGTAFHFSGSLVATRYIQILGASKCIINGEVLTGLVSITQASTLEIYSTIEVEFLLDISESSDMIIFGSLGVGFLQLTDGGKVIISMNNSPTTDNPNDIRHVAVIEDSLIVDTNSYLSLSGLSLLVNTGIYIANHSTVLIPDGDLFLQNSGTIHVIGSTLILSGNCLVPNGAFLVGLGSKVTIGRTLQVSGITNLDLKQGPVDSSLHHKSSVPQSNHSIINHNIQDSHWDNEKTPSINETHRIPFQSMNLHQTSDINQTHEYSSNQIMSSSLYLNTSTEQIHDINYPSNIQLNYTQPLNDTLLFSSTNHTLSLQPIQSRPALFVESSEVYIGEMLEIMNSWLEITRHSVITIGTGVLSRNPNSTILTLRLRSKMIVLTGSVFIGIAIMIENKSLLIAKNGTIIVMEGITIHNHSRLESTNIRSFGSIIIKDESMIHVKKEVYLEGVLFSVSTRSKCICNEFKQKKGDMFISNGGSMMVLNGNIWVYGTVVVQSRGLLQTLNGSLITIRGDIIAENYSRIIIRGVLLIFSAYRQQQRMEARKSNSQNNKDTFSSPLSYVQNTPLFHSYPIQNQTHPNSSEPLFNKTSPMRDSWDDPDWLLPSIGCIRRTTESFIETIRIIPSALHIQIYIQDAITSDMSSKKSSTNSTVSSANPLTTVYSAVPTMVEDTYDHLKEKERLHNEFYTESSWKAMTLARETSYLYTKDPIEYKKEDYLHPIEDSSHISSIYQHPITRREQRRGHRQKGYTV